MLGLSMGGEVALRAAADGIPLRAVVADGAGASTTGDSRLVSHGSLSSLYYAVNWLTMRQVELLSTYEEPAPLKSIVGQIEAPTLLIASNRQDEITIDRKFRALIGPGARLWYVTDSGHTQAFRVHPALYRLSRAVLRDGAPGVGPLAAVAGPDQAAERLPRLVGHDEAVHADHDLAVAGLARQRDRRVPHREAEVAPGRAAR